MVVPPTSYIPPCALHCTHISLHRFLCLRLSLPCQSQHRCRSTPNPLVISASCLLCSSSLFSATASQFSFLVDRRPSSWVVGPFTSHTVHTYSLSWSRMSQHRVLLSPPADRCIALACPLHYRRSFRFVRLARPSRRARLDSRAADPPSPHVRLVDSALNVLPSTLL